MRPTQPLLVLAVLLFALLGGLAFRGCDSPLARLDPSAAARTVSARGDLAADERATIELFEASSPSVVNVAGTEQRRVSRGLWTQDVFEVPKGEGSGFVWSADGYVVTNYHVVEDTSGVEVTLADGTVRTATIVGSDPRSDLAVLRIDPAGLDLRPLPLGVSSDLRVGQKVFAIGSPFGLDQTLTTGVVSALDRVIESVVGTRMRGVIQTDASINPGNSGGPLLDSAGRLIGVNTAIYSPSGSSAGVGFAVPVDSVNAVVPALIARGVVDRPMLGIRMVPDEDAARAGLQGVVVDDVVAGSGAEAAGIRAPLRTAGGWAYDVVVAIDGQRVHAQRDLLRSLENRQDGEEVILDVLRGGSVLQVAVRLSLPR